MDTSRSDSGSTNFAQSLWSWANRDFCPNQNRWAYKLKHPVAVLLIATMLATLCGYIVNPLAYLLAAVLAIVLVVGLAWPAIAIRSTTVSIAWGRTRVHAGDAVTVTVRLTNRLPIPVAGLRLAGLGGLGDARLPRVGPLATKEVGWRTTTTQRGVFPAVDEEAPTVETSLPFGVWTCKKPAIVNGRLTVWPAKVDLNGRVDIGDPRSGEDRLTDRRAGDAGDLLGVRRFRLGDSLRRVHWAQTARQRELIICERQASVSSLVRVGVDIPAEAATREHALSAAASIADAITRTGTSVEVWLGRDVVAATTDSRKIFDQLASVKPREVDERCGDAVDIRVCETAGTTGSRRPHVVVTKDADWQSTLIAAWRRACSAA